MHPTHATSTPTTNGFAVTALILGILGWTMLPVLGSVGAIVFGHMARGQIRRSHGVQDGDGLALAGLILGWVSVGLALLVVAALIFFFGGLAVLAGMTA